jgi:DNA-binding NarL/FixJ family response regulator
MANTTRLLVVDDHRMFAEAIELLLATAEGIEIAGAVGTGEEAVELLSRTRVDVVLMDIDLPGIDGVEATRQIRASHPETYVVIVTALHGSVMARGVEAGASGFVSKTRATEDLVEVIRRAAAGEIVLPPGEIAEVLGKLQRAATSRATAGVALGTLTPRESDILQQIAQGHSTAGIAKSLFISPFTVQTHVKNILAKLGVHSKLEAVTFALRHGALEVSPGGGHRTLARDR